MNRFGVIVKSKKSNNLVINNIENYSQTQVGVLIKSSDIKKHNLKEGDKVEYGGEPYCTVDIYSVIKP